MSQSYRGDLLILSSARGELESFNEEVKRKFYELFEDLSYNGFLQYPDGKKLSGYDLFEIRVKRKNIYRCLYCNYNNNIVILSAFQKKSQKTPKREIEKALKRKFNLSRLDL
jgi:phage-related protein